MPNRLRVGFVGTGPVVERYHIRAVRGVPEFLPFAAVDINEERACDFAKRQNIPFYTSNLQEALQRIDIAIIALPNHVHSKISCNLLHAGIHVLCEKPMARTVEECQAMIDAARESKTQLCIGHNRRFRNNVILARHLIQKGLIGEVVRIEAEEGSTSDWPRSPAYFDPAESGGGALMDVGIHSIDLVRWLAGEFRDVSYTGNGTPTTVESEGEVRFQLATGTEGSVLASRNRELQQRILVTGSEGFVDIGLWSDYLRIRNNKGKAFQQLPDLEAYVARRPPQDGSFVLQLNNLLSAIRGREPVLVDGREGMAAVEVVTRAYRSGESTRAGASTANVGRSASVDGSVISVTSSEP